MKRTNLTLAAAALIASYLAVELAYAVRAPRVMDEFVDAYIVCQFELKLAYRDYRPPKTVLGYYLELPPMAMVRDGWNAMTAVRIELALLTAALLAAAVIVLSRRLDPRAVVASLALLVVMSNFLERSAELRVDPLASLFGLASLLCLIARRPMLAGVACAASFLVTQKGIYFVAAAGVTAFALWLRDLSRERFRALLQVTAACGATLAGYIAFWSAMSPLRTVLASVFFDPQVKAIALTNAYDIRWKYWSQTLARNPFFYALAIAGMVMAGRRWLARDCDDVVDPVVPYALAMTALSIWHKQPWPYFFVFLAPTLFILNASTLDALMDRQWRRRSVIVFAIAFVSFGVLLPLSRVPHALARDNGFQHAMFDAGEQLLAPGEAYIDGVSMLYRREQALPLFDWIDATGLERIRNMKDSEMRALVADLDRRPPKLLIWNYRLAALPRLLQLYLVTHYRPAYGVLFLYAPVVAGPRFILHFDGSYRVGGAAAVIDGAAQRPGAVVQLKRGAHSLGAGQPIRLLLLPPRDIEVDPRYAAPQDLFAHVYDF